MTDERRFDAGSERRMQNQDRRRGDTGTMTQPDPARSTPDDTATSRTNPTYDSPARTSPETMRAEPVESQRTSRQMDYWPEMAQYRQRFDEIQAQFIEEPRQAVQKAEQLVEEAIDKMTNSMREKIRGMHRDAESGDTEKLRVTMRSLRDFIESLGGRRAA